MRGMLNIAEGKIKEKSCINTWDRSISFSEVAERTQEPGSHGIGLDLGRGVFSL